MSGFIGIALDNFLEVRMKLDRLLEFFFLSLGAIFAFFASYTDISDLNVGWATLCVALAIYWKE